MDSKIVPRSSGHGFWAPRPVFVASILLRIVFLIYGLLQDAYAPVRYTDIDYFVFTDASRYVAHGHSPYLRETYRYTPLLAWVLLPTTWGGTFWFSFGKALFAAADIVAGWLLVLVLRSGGRMETSRALKFASIWLLNPMVATISTRGSSEGLLGVMVVALLWAALRRQCLLAGVLLGVGVHLKIYPFIYAPSLILHLAYHDGGSVLTSNLLSDFPKRIMRRECVTLAAAAASTFIGLNGVMYLIYGQPFLEHTFFYHLTRIDHRHNFSPYNTLLYLSAASQGENAQVLGLESLAFVPQLLLSAVLIPLVLTKNDLAGTMLAQTWAFVALNKVCTSQYFLWYMALLPLYMPNSSLLKQKSTGIVALVLWVGAQAAWLQQGFQLEFNGFSTFVPGLWLSGLGFYAVNAWILGIIVSDVGSKA